MLKRILGFAAISVLVMLVNAGSAVAGLRFGVAAEPYPPFTSKDAAGHWIGFEIDVMNAICRQMKEDCEVVEVAWDGIIPALVSKKFDVIWSSMGITEERKKVIDFTDKYFDTPVVLIGAKTGDKDTSGDHLADKTIGVQTSTVSEDYARKHFGKAKVKGYATQDEVNQDLVAGRIDYVLADAVALDAFLHTDPGQGCCEFKSPVPPDPVVLGAGAGGGLRKDDTALKEKLNAAIKAVRASGAYDAIAHKYFNFNVYGE